MTTSWQPTANLAALQKRAEFLSKIRSFFAGRNVMEVETPLLCSTSVTDPYIDSFMMPLEKGHRFLQTSPEYAMKRLLAAGSGSIYQVCKAFRKSESGRLHNPEFTLLEWYRLDFDEKQLMGEVSELVAQLIPNLNVEYISYQVAFEKYIGLNPHCATDRELVKKGGRGLLDCGETLDRHGYLDFLFSHRVMPNLGKELGKELGKNQNNQKLTFIYDFPVCQAALSRIAQDENGQKVAKRFELIMNGIEIANGYYELTDTVELENRWHRDLQRREALKFPAIPQDYNLLAAMKQGLPECAGVALGLDRLLMLVLGADSIDEVLSFGWGRV